MSDGGYNGQIETPHGLLDLTGRARIMGILNVTPDSFSDGGQFDTADAAIQQAERMLAEGADLLDIGGESTRPGAVEVPADEQLRRILPVLKPIRTRYPDTILSVDTRSAIVARVAIEAGADSINDISALAHDPAMLPLLADGKVPVILMHMRGTPATMLHQAHYQDVVAEVIDYFTKRVAELSSEGIDSSRIILDPGIGFAKNAFHNLEILRRLEEFHSLGLPVMVGPSRKRFIERVLGIDASGDRLYGTLAAVAACIQSGARIVRVHDVAPARQVAEMLHAIQHPQAYEKG